MPSDEKFDEQNAYETSLTEYFRRMNLLPLFVSANQKVGDVYDLANRWSFVSASSDCFPELPEPEETPSSLPESIEIKTSEAESVFGLSSLISLIGSKKSSATVKLKFTDVAIHRASQMALRNSLCPQCDFLKPILSQEMKPYTEGDPLYVIIGSVMTARRELFVGDISDAELRADADVNSLAETLPLQVINLEPKASAALGYGSMSGSLLKSDVRLPVAIGPAFYPNLIFDRVQSVSSTEEEPVGVEWLSDAPLQSQSWFENAAKHLPRQ